jgi:hypothetical protein
VRFWAATDARSIVGVESSATSKFLGLVKDLVGDPRDGLC